MEKENDNIKITFAQIEEKQIEKYNDKLSSAFKVGVVIGTLGIGYKVAKVLLNIKKKK